jgi:pyrroline-5-carboxylate reductase
MNIGIIGYGNLAKALGKGLRRDEHLQLWVSAPSLTVGTPEPRLHMHSDNLAMMSHIDCLILAVKPAQMTALLTEIRAHLPPQLLVISVVAGLTIDWFATRLSPTTPLIRAMPNLASECGQGATPLFANRFVTAKQREQTIRAFSACGLATWVTQEIEIDALIALSGSGLAYLFSFTEAMRQAAVKLGLSEDIATSFANQTLQGAAGLAALPHHSLATLQAQVTSNAGTTAAALAVFANHHLNDTVLTAMTAAFDRSSSLSKEL